jgi:hypothetical protein
VEVGQEETAELQAATGSQAVAEMEPAMP